ICLRGVTFGNGRSQAARPSLRRIRPGGNRSCGLFGYAGTGRTESTWISGNPLRARPWTNWAWKMLPARLNAAERYSGVSGTTVPTKASAIPSVFGADVDINARD